MRNTPAKLLINSLIPTKFNSNKNEHKMLLKKKYNI